MEVHHQLRLRVVDSSEEFYQLKPSWDKILSELSECPPFITWEWMYTWWETYKTNATKLLLLVISDNSNIVAIAPFYVRKNSFLIPCNTVYFLGTGEPENMEVCSEYLDFISVPSYSKAVSRSVISYFSEHDNLWERLDLHRVLDNSILVECFVPGASERKFNVETTKCGLRYCVLLPDRWESYLQTLRSSMRRSIAVAQKKFLGEKDCKVEVVENELQIEVFMQELIELHTNSWQARGKQGAFASREFCEFHLKIVKLMYKMDMLMMLRVSVKDEVVAILYNFKAMNSAYYYQSGLNMQKYSSFKPGVLLHSEAIKSAINKNMRFYDFMMAGENTYKSQYGCQTSEMFHMSVWNKSLKARLLQKLALLPNFNRAK